MAEPTTLQLNQLMFTLARDNANDGESFWLGLKYNTTKGNFFWISNNLKMTNPIWGSGQPDLLYGNCVVLDVAAKFWATQDCDKPQRVICQTGKDADDINLIAKNFSLEHNCYLLYFII